MLILFAICLPFGAAFEGQLAYVSEIEGGARAVFVLDLATGDAVKVGPGTGDGAPRWSPDGEWLVFETASEEGMAISMVRHDGSGGRYVMHDSPWNRHPRWAPDGKRIAYASGLGADQRIVVYDLETGRETVWGGEGRGLMRPVWLAGPQAVAILASLDGFDSSGAGLSLFEGGSEEVEGLLAIGLTGEPGKLSTDIRVVTRDETFAYPDWALPSKGRYAEWAVEPSVRSRSVAFESNDGGDREIFVLTRRGAFDVTNHRSADWNPVWSPDGKWIAFESLRSGRTGVYRVHRDTSRVFPIAVLEAGDCWGPSWSGDGKWVAFASNEKGSANLCIAPVSGGALTFITVSPGDDLSPAWRPRPR